MRSNAKTAAIATIATTSVEVNLPFAGAPAIGNGGWAPTLEIGARLSCDLVGRALAPYIGMHCERAFGETARLARRDGEDRSAIFFVAGVQLMF